MASEALRRSLKEHNLRQTAPKISFELLVTTKVKQRVKEYDAHEVWEWNAAGRKPKRQPSDL